MWTRGFLLLVATACCAALPLWHPNSTLSKNRVSPQTLQIWSPLFSGTSTGGVCDDYALPVGTSTSFPSDTINKSFQFWFNIASYPSQYMVMYDTTLTTGVPSHGHKLVLQNDGTIYLQDWANSSPKPVLYGVETSTWYYVCVVIVRSTSTGTGYLYVRKATDSTFAFSQATITTLSYGSTGPIVLGGLGDPSGGGMGDCFNGYIDSFGHWSAALGWDQVETAFQGGILPSDWGMLGFYPMNGGNVGSGTLLPSTGGNPVTGTLVGAIWQVVTGHNICLCNGYAPSDTLAHCSGTSNGCNNYCENGQVGVTCLGCPAGKYGTVPSCTCCALNYYSNAGQTECTTCGPYGWTERSCTSSASYCLFNYPPP